MGENKHIKKLKIGGVKPSTFAANVKNSVKYTVEDVSKELAPYAFDFANANVEIGESLNNVIKTLNPKNISKTIKNSSQYNDVKTGLKNARKDIKKGIFNNRKRQAKSMGMDFDFDLDFDDNFDFDESSIIVSEGDTDNSVTNIFAGSNDSLNLSSTIKETAGTHIKFSSEQHSQQLAALASINDNLTKLVAFQNETTVKHYEETARYYANTTQLQQDLKDLLTPKEKEVEDRKETDFERVIGSDGVINFTEYGKTIINKNLPDLLDDLTSGMFSMTKEMSKDMMSDSFENFKNNPLGVISSSLLKNAIPKDFKDTLDDFNKALADSVRTFAHQMNTKARQDTFEFINDLEMEETGHIKKGLGFVLSKLLKLDMGEQKERLNTSRYEKGAVPFDGVTKKAITEVIPMYLRKILSAVQGTKDEIIYDYNEGKAVWASEKEKHFQAEKLMREMSGFYDAKDKVSSYLFEKMKIKDIYENDERANKFFQNDLDVVLSSLKDISLPRIDDESSIEKFKSHVMDKRDINGNILLSDDSAIQPILAAIHASLNGKEKLALAGNSFDSLQMQNMFMEEQQEKLLETGMSQILATKDIALKRSKDYRDAYLFDNNAERVVQLRRQDDKGGLGLGGVNSYVKDIYRLLLEGIIVHPTSGIGGDISNNNANRLAKLDEDENILKEYFERRQTRKNDYRVGNYLLQGNDNEHEGLGYTEFSELYNMGDVVSLAKQMRQVEKEQELAKKKEKEDKKENFLQKMFKSPFNTVEKSLKSIMDNLSIAFYGSADERKQLFTVEDGEKLPFEKAVVKTIIGISGKFDKFIDAAKDQFNKFKKFLFGEKGENGESVGGIMSPLKNMYIDLYRRGSNLVTGNKKTLTSGEVIEERENSVKSMFKNEFGKLKVTLFGTKETEEGEEAKEGLFGRFKKSVNNSLGDIQEFIFGKGKKKSSEELKEKFKDYAPNAIFGGSLGLLGSLFLPGGPLLGAITGSLMSIGAKSGHLETMLFGSKETGQDILGKKFKGLFEYELVKKGMNKIEGNLSMVKGGGLGLLAGLFLPGGPLLGATVGSLIGLNEKTNYLDKFLFGSATKEGDFEKGLFDSKFFEKRSEIKKDALTGGTIGLLGGLFLPGGPLLGATAGTLLGFNKKTGFLQDFLFGKEGSDERNYFSKLTESTKGYFKKYGFKALKLGSFGLLGSMFLPGGPIVSSLLGMTVGSKLSNVEFRKNLHKFIFGDFNPETGEGRLGQLPQLLRTVEAQIVNPIKSLTRNFVEDTRYFLNRHVLIPMKHAFKPFTDLGKHAVGKVKDFFKDSIVSPIVDTMNVVLDPLRKLATSITRAVTFVPRMLLKGLMKLPVMMFTGLSNKVANFNAKHGIGEDYEEREQRRLDELSREKNRHKQRKTEIKNIDDIERRKSDAIVELSRLQRADAKNERLEKKLKKQASNNFSKEQQAELDILDKERKKANDKLKLRNRMFLNSEDTAKARDKAAQANRLYNEKRNAFRKENLDSYLTPDSDGSSQFDKDKKDNLADIGLEKLIQLEIIKSGGAYDYKTARDKVLKRQEDEKETASSVEKSNDNIQATKDNSDKIVDSSQDTAENTGLIVNIARDILGTLRGEPIKKDKNLSNVISLNDFKKNKLTSESNDDNSDNDESISSNVIKFNPNITKPLEKMVSGKDSVESSEKDTHTNIPKIKTQKDDKTVDGVTIKDTDSQTNDTGSASFFQEVRDEFRDLKGQVKTDADDVAKASKSIFRGPIEAMKNFKDTLVDTVKDIFTAPIKIFKGVLSIPEKTMNTFNKFKDSVSSMKENLGLVGSTFKNILFGNGEKGTKGIVGRAKGLFSGLGRKGKDFNAINEEKAMQVQDARNEEMYHGFKGLFKNTETTSNTLVESAKRGFKLGKMLLFAIPVIMKIAKAVKDFFNGGITGLFANSIKPGGFLHKFGNNVVSNFLGGLGGMIFGKGKANGVVKAAIGKVFGNKANGLMTEATESLAKEGAEIAAKAAGKKGIKSVGKTALNKGSDMLAKSFIGKGFKNFLKLGPVKRMLGDSGIKALGQAGGELFKKAGSKVLTKAGSAIAAAPLTAAFVGADLVSGFSNPRKVLKIGKDAKVTLGMRSAAAVGKALANNLLFGLVPESTVSKIVYNAVGGNSEGDKLSQMQEEFKQKAKEAGMTVNDYNNEVNKGIFGQSWDFVKNAFKKTGSFLFGETETDQDGNKVQTKKGILNPFSWFRQNKKEPRQNVVDMTGEGHGKRNGRGYQNVVSVSAKANNSVNAHVMNVGEERAKKSLEYLGYISKATIAIAEGVYSRDGHSLYSLLKTNTELQASANDNIIESDYQATQQIQQQLDVMSEQNRNLQDTVTVMMNSQNQPEITEDYIIPQEDTENKVMKMVKGAVGGVGSIAKHGFSLIAQSVITAALANPVFGGALLAGGGLALSDVYARGFDSVLGKTLKKVLMMPVNLFKNMAVGLDKAILKDKNITDNIVKPMVNYAKNNYGLFLNKQEKIAWKKLKDSEKLQKTTLKDVFTKNYSQEDFEMSLLEENKKLGRQKKYKKHKKVLKKANRFNPFAKKSVDVDMMDDVNIPNEKSNYHVDYYKKRSLFKSQLQIQENETQKMKTDLDIMREKHANLIKAQNSIISKNKNELTKVGTEATNMANSLNKSSNSLMVLNERVDDASRNINVDSDGIIDIDDFVVKDAKDSLSTKIKNNKYYQKVAQNRHVQSVKGGVKSGFNKVANNEHVQRITQSKAMQTVSGGIKTGINKAFDNPVTNFMASKSQSALSAVPGLLSKVPVIGPAINAIPGLSGLLSGPAAGTILSAVAPVLPIVAAGGAIFGLHKFGPQIEQFVDELPDKIVTLIEKSVTFIFKDLPKIVLSAGKTLLKLMVKIPLVIPKTITKLAKNMISTVGEFGRGIWTSIKTGVSNIFSKVAEPFVRFGETVKNLLSAPVKFFKELIFGKNDKEVEDIKNEAKPVVEEAKVTQQQPTVQNTVSISNGSGRGNIIKPLLKKAVIAGTTAASLTGIMPNMPESIHVNRILAESMRNPVISSVTTALEPIYGNAAPVVAPGIVGLTLNANRRVLEILDGLKTVNGTSNSLENNVTYKQIKEKEEREAKKSGIFGTISSAVSDISSSIPNLVSNIATSISDGFSNSVEWIKDKLGLNKSEDETETTENGSGRGILISGRGGRKIYSFNGRGTNNGFTYFNQNDPRWGSQPLSNGDGDTVGSAGCGPTAVAMALSSRGVDTDPSQAASYAQAYKVKNEGVTADFISDYSSQFGVNLTGRTVDNYTANDIDMSLASGQPVVALGRSTSSSDPYTSAGHYVTISGKDSNGNYKVSDPLNESNNSKSFSPSELFSSTQAYWTDSSIDGSMAGMDSLMGYGSSYGKPIADKDGTLTSPYGNRTLGGKTHFHSGIDYGTYKQEGKSIYAVSDGEVYRTENVPYNGESYGYGTHIRLKHTDGNRSLYAHLSKILVNNGQKVKKGQIIGRSGNTGWSTGPHLHFELRDGNDKTFDPYPYVINGTDVPAGSEAIAENPNEYDKSNASNKFDINNILSTVQGLFKGFITGNFDDLTNSDGTDGTTSDSSSSSSSSGVNTISLMSQSERAKAYKGGTVDFSSFPDKQENFFNAIQKDAMQNYIDYGVLPSLTLAQAAHESGWGESGLAVQGKALFGIKPGSSWTGKVYVGKTTEYYDGKNPTHIKDAFRAYNNWGESVNDHGKLLSNSSRYENVVKAKTYQDATKAIYQAGYATDPSYTTKLNDTIRKYKLEEADKLVGRGETAKRKNTLFNSSSLGKGPSLLKKVSAKTKSIFEGKGYENLATKVEKASSDTVEYMQSTANKINSTLDTSYILERMMITLDTISEVLGDIRNTSSETAKNTREIADKEFTQVSSGDSVVNNTVEVEGNKNSSKTVVKAGDKQNIFAGSANNSKNDPYSNLKSKVMRIAQG